MFHDYFVMFSDIFSITICSGTIIFVRLTQLNGEECSGINTTAIDSQFTIFSYSDHSP